MTSAWSTLLRRAHRFEPLPNHPARRAALTDPIEGLRYESEGPFVAVRRAPMNLDSTITSTIAARCRRGPWSRLDRRVRRIDARRLVITHMMTPARKKAVQPHPLF